MLISTNRDWLFQEMLCHKMILKRPISYSTVILLVTTFHQLFHIIVCKPAPEIRFIDKDSNFIDDMGHNKSNSINHIISEEYNSHKDYAVHNNKVTSDSINIEESPSNDKLIEVSSGFN